MTKDDPTVQLSGPQTMEENISRFNLNLNEPLTDQLAKHKLLQRDEEWRETAREAKQQTGYDSKQIDYGGNSRRINCEYVYSEVVDLAAPKGSTGVLSQNSDCSDRSFNDGKANLCLVGGVVENENSRKHNRNGCAKQGKSSPDYIGGSARSDCNDQLKKTDRNRFCERPELSFHPTDAATTKYLSEAAGKVLTSPPLLLKKNPGGDGGGGVKPGSAFLPIEQRISREISCGGISTVYNIPVYPFCVLPFPATTSGPAYPPLSSHPPPVQSSAPDNRLLSKVQSPSAGAQLLSPRVMYSDPHATHRLEALWQQKYPHFPVPPAWMLHQYTDELLRDTTGSTAQPPLASSTVDRLTGREFFGASSIVNSMPVIPSPVDTICVEKKRDRMDDVQDNKRFAAVDAKRTDGRRKDELQTRRANVSKEQKGHQAYFTPDPQTRDNKTSSACHWDRSGPPSRPEFLSGVSRVPAAAAAAAALRRTEHLVDEFATSAGDAVDQHFQESFLRLNSQTRLDKTKSGREIQLDRSTEKHGIYWNNGYQNWKDSRLSRVQDLQQDKITFDIYGYQSQQRPAYSPERLSDATKIDSFPNKYDKPTFKNEHQEQLLHCFSDKKSQEHHWRPNSGFPAIVNPKMDVKDFRHDGWNQLNTPSRVPDKQLPRTCPTKRINDGKFQTGSQSIASPTPGSVVRESRLGPSRLIAGSPRPLPSVFYNPLDPRMEAVQPYQVSIESVERCPGTWMQYPYDWLINGASSNGLRQQKADGIPPEAHTRLQHGLIPSPAHSSVVRGCDGIEYRTRIMESNHNKSILSASNGAESVNVSNNKRFVERDDDDDDAPQCLKKVKTESVVPRNDELPLVNIGDFKSFVDRAVHDAFHEGSNGRSEAQRVSSSGSSVTKSYNVAALMEQDEERQRMSECGLRCSSDVTDSATTAATQRPTSGHSLTTSGRKSPEIAVELTTLSGKSWSRVESGSDALSTLSSDTSASDDQKGDASNCPSTSNAASASSLHPVLSSRFSPSPRASLPVKKAWLIRYSDNDQKPASDASTSCFPNAGLDDNRLDREKFSFAHTLNSSSENSRLLPFGKSSENPASYIFDSADDRTNEAKTPVSSVVSISKSIPSKDTDSNYSETSVDSNISKNQKSKNPKRSLPSELPSRHTKMAKSASTQKNLTANGEKSRRMREKNSKIWDNSSSSTVEAASDCHSNPSQLRKKRRVRSTRGALDLKDESLDSCDRRSTSEVFLQDGSCLKVAPRLPKCRECKAQRSNRNGQQNANICKFDAFRKLCYNGKGLLNVAGFLGPADIEADDVDLWLPCKSKHTSLGVGDGQYLMTHLKEFFTRLLRQDTSLKFSESSEVEPGSLLWHRPMEGVQETCDTCDTTVFDVHWTCKKCGFVVCNECHSRQVAADETEDQDETRKMDWPLCSAKRQHHSPDDLSLTQIIPQEAVSALMQKFSRLMDGSKSANETFGNDKPNGKSDEETNAEEDESEVKKKCSTFVTGLTSSGVKQHAPEDLACAKPTSRPICEEAGFTEIGTASKLSPDDIDKEQEQDSCNCSDLPKPKEAQMSTDAVVTSSSPEPPYGALVIGTRSDTKSLEQFQRQWRQSMPVVVRSCKEGGFCSDLWRPDAFTKRFGHLRLELVSCLNGTTHRFQSAEKFWNGFRNASSGKNAGLLRFKDWPLADDWTGALGDHCADLNRALPIPGYTLADGQFNLAAHLPGFFHQPDLATRIHVGYGNLAQGHVTLSKMQANPVDFVNVVTFADHKVPNDSLESRASCVTQLLEDSHFVGNSSQFTENPDKVVAVWHVYHPMYSNKIQAFLNKVSGNTSWKSGDQNRSGSPSDTGGYLDAELLDRLQSEVGVHPVVIVQCLCDAVFIPASAFYQMKVVRECVSVTKEFISSESIKSSFSTQPPDGNNSRNYKQEHFQIKNLVYHTMKDCIGVLERPDL